MLSETGGLYWSTVTEVCSCSGKDVSLMKNATSTQRKIVLFFDDCALEIDAERKPAVNVRTQ